MMKIKKSNKKVLMIIIILMISSLFSSCDKKRLILSGSIETEQYDVNSESAGKVVNTFKDEGETVVLGEVLAQVDASIQENQLKQQIYNLNSKFAQLSELKKGSRAEQIRSSLAQSEALQNIYKQVEAQYQSSVLNYEYLSKKFEDVKQDYQDLKISQSEFDDFKIKIDSAKEQDNALKSQLESAKKQYEASKSQYELINNGPTTEALTVSQSVYNQAESLVELAQLNVEKTRIKANSSGVFSQKNIKIGDIIGVGTSIGIIIDKKDMSIKFYIPQKNLKLVSVDNIVEMTTTALENKVIKGKIIFVSQEAEFTPKNIETNEAKENTVYKIKIKILDNIENLRAGMTMRLSIPLQ